MEYIDAVKLFRDIEKDYDVMSIKYKGVALWPYFRIYLFDTLTSQRAAGYTSSALKVLLSSLLHYNPIRFFKRYDIWNYSSSTTRKKIGKLFEHHVSGYLQKSPYKVLTIEMQSPGIRIIKNNEIPEKNIVSGSWPLALTAFIEICMRPLRQRLDGEYVLCDIIRELGVRFDYKKRLRWIIAQKRSTDFFLAIGRKPKLMILECYYTQMGRIWSAHKHKIPVVELQHGVLNANHYAYNPTYHSELLYPNEICVYGEEEYKYFSEKETSFAKKVSMTGLYMLDRSTEFFTNDIFADLRKKYKKICVVAGQPGCEEFLSSFIDKMANRLPDTFFIYKPRHSIILPFQAPNVELKVDVNIYEYLKWCDYHVTISSTTAIEAHYYKKPILFYDLGGVAKEYYGKILGNENGAFYIQSEEDFLKVQLELDQTRYKYRELFAHDSEKRMKSVLDRYLSL
jgi:hypothetical protein